MSKIIAIFGHPGSGKTGFGVKLAQQLCQKTGGTVYFLSPDTSAPTLSYLFPHRKRSDLHSLGKALDRTSVQQNHIIQHTVTTKELPMLGYLGYMVGESKYSYPLPTRDKVEALFSHLSALAEYIVVDCTGDPEDAISRYALRNCYQAIRLVTPDLKCMGYWQSATDFSIPTHTLNVLNENEGNVYPPTVEVKAFFEGLDVSLPFSLELKKQAITGSLSSSLADKKYKAALDEIVRRVME